MARKEIRKKVRGNPILWESSIVLDSNEGPYIKDFDGSLRVQQTQKDFRISLYSAPGADNPEYRRGYDRSLREAREMERTVFIDPDLVIYNSKDDGFYAFSHFSGNRAIFKFLKGND